MYSIDYCVFVVVDIYVELMVVNCWP